MMELEYRSKNSDYVKIICKQKNKHTKKIFLNFMRKLIAFRKKMYYNKIRRRIQKFPNAGVLGA